MSYHRSILLEEILDFALAAKRGASLSAEKSSPTLTPFWILDGTLGDGGHSLALLQQIPEARLLGFDEDPVMLRRAQKRLQEAGISVTEFQIEGLSSEERMESDQRGPLPNTSSILNKNILQKKRAFLINENFSEAAFVLDALQMQPNFILLDVGVSEFHFRGAARGFSYLDESLDMRLDPRRNKTAREIVNFYPEEKLKKIFTEYGEERFSGRIARSIAASRPIESAQELAEIICRAVPAPKAPTKKRKRPASRIHPATRVFQALRIEVNQELAVLEQALADLPLRLAPGGRMAVLTFHSLEDRLAKRAFRKIGKKKSTGASRQKQAKSYEAAQNKNFGANNSYEKDFWILTPKPLVASAEEIAQNPSARSAKLRVLERQ